MSAYRKLHCKTFVESVAVWAVLRVFRGLLGLRDGLGVRFEEVIALILLLQSFSLENQVTIHNLKPCDEIIDHTRS